MITLGLSWGPPHDPPTHTRIAHKHTHGLHTNTHTDCTKHTHGLHTNTHILLLIVVSALKTGTKRHTYLTRKSIFFWRGAPATENIFAFFGHPGRPRHRKIRYFWRPGALSQKKHTHELAPGSFQPLNKGSDDTLAVSRLK